MSTVNAFLTAIDTDGNVQVINVGTNDNSSPIYYELETQELEFGERSHIKQVQDKIVVLTQNAVSSKVFIKQNEKDYDTLGITLDSTVSVSSAPSYKFNYLTFKWFGNSINLSPVFDGLYFEKVFDFGMKPK